MYASITFEQLWTVLQILSAFVAALAGSVSAVGSVAYWLSSYLTDLKNGVDRNRDEIEEVKNKVDKNTQRAEANQQKTERNHQLLHDHITDLEGGQNHIDPSKIALDECYFCRREEGDYEEN